MKPTTHQFKAYQAAYDYFNRKLFGGKLKPCLLSFRDRCKHWAGLFWANKWIDADGWTTHEIALNPDVLRRPMRDSMATLVHEMCHQWQHDFGIPPRRAYHDKEWAACMVGVGLMPSDTGAPGGKTTGQNMTHFIIEGGPFDRAFRAAPKTVTLPWRAIANIEKEKEKKESKKKTKYTCPECEANVWGKPDMSLVCGDCDAEFEVEGEK